MLIVPMAQFMALSSPESWHIHAIVVHESEIPIDDEHIAVLKIAMSNTMLSQSSHHGYPSISEDEECRRVAKMLLDIGIESVSLYPLHLQNRIPLPSHSNALGKKSKFDSVGKLGRRQMLTDGSVALLLVVKLTQETPNSPFTLPTLHAVHACKTTIYRTWETKGSECWLSRFEFWIIKIEMRVLDRLIVVLRGRPRHEEELS